jgi:topoisomerase-4 subunit B
MARSKAYLFSGVEIRWKCDPSLIRDDTPDQAVFHFPGGLADYLKERLEGARRESRERQSPRAAPYRRLGCPVLGRMRPRSS